MSRLQEHRRDPEKDYWTEAAVFTASDNSPGATELSSLEHRFCTMAPEAKRYDVKNGNDPNFGSTTEEKMCAMEELVENARVMMGTLGHKLFEPLTHWTVQTTQPADGEVAAERRLYLKRTVNNVGTMEGESAQSAEGFVVLRGALCRRWGRRIPASVKELRAAAPLNEKSCLLEDLLFSSPTYAAIFLTGKSSNGTALWKDRRGRTLKSLEEEADGT